MKNIRYESGDSQTEEGVDAFLKANGKVLHSAINTLLKVYSEQIILLQLYSRDITYQDESMTNRLKLIAFIDTEISISDIRETDDENETNLQDKINEIKFNLINHLNSGFDFFSVLSLLDSKSSVAQKIKDFSAENNIVFGSYTTSKLPYTCSQMSSSIKEKKIILTSLAAWLDTYSHDNIIDKKVKSIIERRENTPSILASDTWDFSPKDLDNIGHLVLTECHEEIAGVYEIINRYVPTQGYSVKKEVITNKTEALESGLLGQSKFDFTYSQGSLTHLFFDTRLMSEGDKEELMMQIENTLYGKQVKKSIGRGEPQKVLLLSDIKALNKWHKNTNVLIKRLDQIPRFIASIVEFDLKRENQGIDVNDWYKFVTEKIAKHFAENNFMEPWNTYSKQSTSERFKKRVNYLKFGLKSYKSSQDVVVSAIIQSKGYPLQSTTFPPLWRPPVFHGDAIYR